MVVDSIRLLHGDNLGDRKHGHNREGYFSFNRSRSPQHRLMNASRAPDDNRPLLASYAFRPICIMSYHGLGDGSFAVFDSQVWKCSETRFQLQYVDNTRSGRLLKFHFH